MKANNLEGDYCMNCASILNEAQRNFRKVVILDAQCAMIFSQSGDLNRFDEPKPVEAAKPEPAIPAAEPEAKKETAKVQETVHAKPHAKKGGKR